MPPKRASRTNRNRKPDSQLRQELKVEYMGQFNQIRGCIRAQDLVDPTSPEDLGTVLHDLAEAVGDSYQVGDTVCLSVHDSLYERRPKKEATKKLSKLNGSKQSTAKGYVRLLSLFAVDLDDGTDIETAYLAFKRPYEIRTNNWRVVIWIPVVGHMFPFNPFHPEFNHCLVGDGQQNDIVLNTMIFITVTVRYTPAKPFSQKFELAMAKCPFKLRRLSQRQTFRAMLEDVKEIDWYRQMVRSWVDKYAWPDAAHFYHDLLNNTQGNEYRDYLCLHALAYHFQCSIVLARSGKIIHFGAAPGRTVILMWGAENQYYVFYPSRKSFGVLSENSYDPLMAAAICGLEGAKIYASPGECVEFLRNFLNGEPGFESIECVQSPFSPPLVANEPRPLTLTMAM